MKLKYLLCKMGFHNWMLIGMRTKTYTPVGFCDEKHYMCARCNVMKL